jgi:CheY-like chemotaxis protein/DNA-binding CsgD family transcriptional regulator
MSANRGTEQGTVMIVDDAPGNLSLLSDALEEAGYRVLVATDGQSTLEQLRYIRPDIILLDAVMPGMDGFETCRRIKADPSKQSIPILFMTALSDLDDLLRGFNEGAVDYIAKPIRHLEVLARVGAHLAQSRKMRLAEESLSHCGFAALSVDESLRITWMSEAAHRWLAELSDNAFNSHNDGLPKSLADWVSRHIELAAKVEPDVFTTASGGRKFSARLIPCQAEREFLLLLQEDAGEWNLNSLREGLGLTPREAEILMWIARGKTNRDVGLILGSSPRTVNKHLEHVFEKLGVGTRAAAVAVALERMRHRSGDSQR